MCSLKEHLAKRPGTPGYATSKLGGRGRRLPDSWYSEGRGIEKGMLSGHGWAPIESLSQSVCTSLKRTCVFLPPSAILTFITDVS